MEKSRFYPILILFWLTSCQTQTLLQKTEWLLGTWENKTSKGIIYETWTKQNEQELSAKSYLLQGEDTVFLETVRILQKKDSLFYIPTVANQNEGKSVSFTMTKITPSQMTFENLAHDFPQRISYQKIHEDSLLATISGTRAGQTEQRFFPMSRKR